MKYIFIVNGRADMVDRIDAELEKQLKGVDIDYDVYHTEGVGDGIRYVRIYCDLHPEEEVCFVACGGSGTTDEVASGIVGFKNKSMAILAYGSTNDLTKYYPDRDFKSLSRILSGENTLIDIVKLNDNYSLNVACVGFDAMVSYVSNAYIIAGMPGVKAFRKGVVDCLLSHRRNNVVVTADGERLNRKRLLLCTMSNASWCGGQYFCAPRAKVDDGLIEVCLFKTCTLLEFLIMMSFYEKGTHLESPFCRKRLVYRRARHLELDSKSLIMVGLDGETFAASHFDVDIVPKAINLVLPAKD